MSSCNKSFLMFSWNFITLWINFITLWINLSGYGPPTVLFNRREKAILIDLPNTIPCKTPTCSFAETWSSSSSSSVFFVFLRRQNTALSIFVRKLPYPGCVSGRPLCSQGLVTLSRKTVCECPTGPSHSCHSSIGCQQHWFIRIDPRCCICTTQPSAELSSSPTFSSNSTRAKPTSSIYRACSTTICPWLPMSQPIPIQSTPAHSCMTRPPSTPTGYWRRRSTRRCLCSLCEPGGLMTSTIRTTGCANRSSGQSRSWTWGLLRTTIPMKDSRTRLGMATAREIPASYPTRYYEK